MTQDERAQLIEDIKTNDSKRRVIVEAEKCGFGQLGSLLRREGLTYTQLSEWRKAYAEGRLSDKRRGPQANPNLPEVRRLDRKSVV